MDNHNKLDRVWEILEKHSVGMLTTHFDDGLRARPLEARPDRESGVIYFVTDVRGLKDDEIKADSTVGFVIVDEKENAYLSISGRADVMRDSIQTAKIWRKTDDVWWPGGPDDQNVRVIRLEPSRAELWDGPKWKAVAMFEFAKAKLTGEKPNLGEKRKVTVDLKT